MKGRRIAWGRIIACLLLLGLIGWGIGFGIRLWLIYSGKIIANQPDPHRYQVRGVDVSRYQGTIDWEVLAGQDVTFAFIKATEGSSYQDPCFAQNWRGAGDAGVYAGAYHFFSFESSGETQAQNFIDTVGSLDGKLPPVVDLEFYGNYTEAPLSKKETRKILNDLLDALEDHYGVKPIIYTTSKAYYSYIFGGYGDYPMWMRNTYMKPMTKWRFWQYSDEGMLDGYDGKQTDQETSYIDLDVYNGSIDKFCREFELPVMEETS